MKTPLRFKPSLALGAWKDNPETLIRSSTGEYVKFEEYEKIKKELEEARNILEDGCRTVRCSIFNIMSNKYKHIKDVPTEEICERLEELSTAVTNGSQSINREFTMRVPAELDRDPDIILAEASRRLRSSF